MILLLGGTLESREIAKLLSKEKIEYTVSTVTKYGGQLAEQVSLNVQSKVLDHDNLLELCEKKKILLIIDATHPFAQNISLNAIKVAQGLGIKYIRFERKALHYPQNSPLIHLVNDMAEAVVTARQLGSKFLLTIGSRQLHYFQELIQNNNEVYVRVLPDINSIQQCLNLGLQPQHIIGLQGPFSKEFNKALIQEKKIEVVVSKESGTIGGVDTKIAACLELQIPIVIVARPKISYPLVVSDYEMILQEVKNGI